MSIGIYFHEEKGIGGIGVVVSDDLKAMQIPAAEHNTCLCQLKQSPLEDDVLCHPSEAEPDCFKEISRVIDANPGKNFYVFANDGTRDRIKQIGDHPNLDFVGLGCMEVRKMVDDFRLKYKLS